MNVLKSDKGAVPAIVLLAAACLIILSAFALTAGVFHLNESKAAARWNTLFYELDADGQIFIEHTNAALAIAEERAVKYIQDKGYEAEKYEGVPVDLQTSISGEYNRMAYMTSAYGDQTPLEELIEQAFAKMYFYEAQKAIDSMQRDLYFSLSAKHSANWHSPNFSVLPFASGNIISAIHVSMTFYSEQDDGYRLTATIAAAAPDYTIKKTRDGVTGTRDFSEERYTIAEWRQWTVE
jgi:hypothetical protein